MGSVDGGTYRTIRKLEPNAAVLEGMPIEMTTAERSAADQVSAWLKKLNLD